MNLKLIDLWARMALSLWVVGILAGYLWQFRDTILSLLHIFGFS